MSYQADITTYLDVLRRRKNILTGCILASLIIGSTIALVLPPVYRAQATLYYVSAEIPKEMLVSFVNAYLEGSITFLEAMVFGRDRCLQIINEVDLYPDLKKKLPADDVAAYMKTNYSSENKYVSSPGTGGGRADEVMIGFTFHFEDKSPKKAFDVANILASDFIANYKKFRESFATNTSSFFLDEQNRLKDEMLKLDKKISEFKEKHVDELPELFQTNYQHIQTLNQQILSLDQEARSLMDRKILVESQLAQIQPSSPLEGLSGQRIITPEEKLESLKSELALLQSSLSEKHPDIIRVRSEIEGLEKTLSRAQKTTASQDKASTRENYWSKKFNDIKAQGGTYNPAYVQLVTQLDEINAMMQSLSTQKGKLKDETEKYQQRIESSPLIEKEYNSLTRDLDSAKTRYNQLVNQALQADSSAAMEKREIGGKFIISEPPIFPLQPVRPNRLLIVGTSLVLGILLGFLLIFSWEFLNLKVRSVQDITQISSSPVLLELPEIPRIQQKGGRNVKKLAISLIIIFLVPVVLFAVNKYFSLELDITVVKLIGILKKNMVILGL
jgi:polysaccharide biosynthesis transport protein